MKQVIVTADDFGLSLGVAKGIIKALKEGIVTETCAITNSPDFKESAALALESGISKMGVHLNATVLKPLTESENLAAILNEKGAFHKVWLKNDVTDEMVDALRVEFKAQIETLLATGLKLSHINSHHGLGMFSPKLWQLLQELAHDNQVPLRNEMSLLDEKDDACMVLHMTDPLASIINRLEKAQGDVIELCCHPGYADETLAAVTSLTQEREADLSWVISLEVKQAFAEHLELVDYSESNGD